MEHVTYTQYDGILYGSSPLSPKVYDFGNNLLHQLKTTRGSRIWFSERTSISFRDFCREAYLRREDYTIAPKDLKFDLYKSLEDTTQVGSAGLFGCFVDHSNNMIGQILYDKELDFFNDYSLCLITREYTEIQEMLMARRYPELSFSYHKNRPATL